MAVTGQQDGDNVDHYEVLRLPSGEEGAALSVKKIKKAYRAQSLLRHPDKRPGDPNTTVDFKSLKSSYEFLLDESLRRQFDARLRGRRKTAARVGNVGPRGARVWCASTPGRRNHHESQQARGCGSRIKVRGRTRDWDRDEVAGESSEFRLQAYPREPDSVSLYTRHAYSWDPWPTHPTHTHTQLGFALTTSRRDTLSTYSH
jgi:curved DNA-binding protein CbpA